MKKLSTLNKIVFFVNNVFALLLLLSIIIPYIKPKSFPLISVLSLAVPFLIFTHLLFILYWLFNGIKKQFYLSALCILFSILFSYFPYKFREKKTKVVSGITVLNYNVHLFNRYSWIKKENILDKISNFIGFNNPDIVTLQEYYNSSGMDFGYKYKYIKLKGKSNFGQAIFSKYRIIKKGSLDFKNTSNNVIYADIVKGNDTIRVYNIHLESIGITGDSLNLSEKYSKIVIKKLAKSFGKQQLQVEEFKIHQDKCNYKTIICGDFNNTAYSWVYNKIKGDFKDTFLEAGKGFGKTFDFYKYPLRIDFILVDPELQVNRHQNFSVNFSDHEPILANLDF